MSRTHRNRPVSWSSPRRVQGRRRQNQLRQEIEEEMTFNSNVMPKRFGAGRPKDKPEVEQERPEEPEKADSSAADEDD